MNSKRPAWGIPSYLWAFDGAWKDIYIHDTNQQDWEKFIELAKKQSLSYKFDGENGVLPSVSDIFKNRTGTHLLSLQIGNITINCHFFTQEEIEMDIDPREVKSENDQNLLFDFVESISHMLEKSAIITHENCPENPYLKYDPLQKNWHIFEI